MKSQKLTISVDALSDEALLHLKAYKYSSVDKSLLSNYVLRHYWNAFVQLLPLWLAPNMVTLLGFFCVLINILILYIYDPDLDGSGPRWIYYSFALGVWMYSTMDNVDGKQARRTGTSSGLGELFDHGIDSLNCTLASLLETAAMGLGPSKTGAFTAMVPCLPMFFSTWETYHTHTLYLGIFNGPTEGLLIASSLMAISGYFGPEIWRQPLPTIIPDAILNLLSPETQMKSYTFSLRDIWVPILLSAFFFVHLPFCIYHVVEARRRQNLPVAPVFVEWTPMLVFSLASALWLGSPHSSLLKDNHLTLWCLTTSFVFGRLTTKIILHHLTRQSFPVFTVLLYPLVGGAALGNLPTLGNILGVKLSPINPALEAWYLRAYFVYAMVVYMTWAVRVIDRICAFLDINCLTIKKKKTDMEGKVANGDVKTPKKVKAVESVGNGSVEESGLRRSTRRKV
jgi:ethanolaminephosphotransferase